MINEDKIEGLVEEDVSMDDEEDIWSEDLDEDLDDVEGETDVAPSQTKKKSSNIMLYATVAVIGGGVIYFMMGQQQPSQPVQQVASGQVNQQVAVADQSTGEMLGEGVAFNAVPNVSHKGDEGAMPVGVAKEDSPLTPVPEMSEVKELPALSIPMVTKEADEKPAPKAEEGVETVQMANTTSAARPTEKGDVHSSIDHNRELNFKSDQMLNESKQADLAVSMQADMHESIQDEVSDAVETLKKSFESKISDLGRELSFLKNEMKQASGSKDSAALKMQLDSFSKDMSALARKVDQLASKIDRITPTKVPSNNNTQAKVVTKQVAPVKMQASASDWSIRAVHSGAAILYNQKTSDTISARVGESVEGIGEIQEISYSNGVWVVKGKVATITRK